MYTLKGISFVANASLFDISIIFFCCVARVFLCRKKNKKQKDKKRTDGWMKSSKMRHRQRKKVCFFFSIDRSKSFFVCKALCVCVLDGLFVDFWYGYISRRRRAMFHQKM